MKRLKQILNNIEFEHIWRCFLSYYPDLKETKEQYNNVFSFLQELKPLNNDDNTIIHIDVVEPYDFNSDSLADQILSDDETEYRVHAKDDSPDWDGYIDISFCFWEQWLGFYIEESVLTRFKEEEIIALCLYEMTWLGYDNESVKKRILNVDKKDIDN